MGYDRKPGLTTQIANGGQYEDADTSSSFSYQQMAAESTSSALQSATEAAASAASASTSATNAGASAGSASTSATTATAAATTATNASNSAVNAAATTAGSVTSASNSATSANTSANSASASAANALAYSNNASASASSANSAMVSAQSARDSAIAVYDNFDDRYLGPKASDPSVDNDGNALLTGALYFNTTSNVMKVYSGSAWIVSYASVVDVNLATQVTGTLAIANGGTGQTSANNAFNALAPSQTSNSGKYLSTDGSTTAWTAIAGFDPAYMGYTTRNGQGTTTVLTSASTIYQVFTGTGLSNSTVQLPVTSTLANGWTFNIRNDSIVNVLVRSSGSDLLITIPYGCSAMVTCISTSGTTAASWRAGITNFTTYTGVGNVVLHGNPTIQNPNITTGLLLSSSAGSIGQVLTSAGSGAPTWTTPASGGGQAFIAFGV
jgi:hypothetical protein